MNAHDFQMFALLATALVTNWSRSKLMHYVHRLGIDDLFHRIVSIFSRNTPKFRNSGHHPLVNMSDDEESEMSLSGNSQSTKIRKKLHHHHIKDASEGEKLISGSTLSESNRR